MKNEEANRDYAALLCAGCGWEKAACKCVSGSGFEDDDGVEEEKDERRGVVFQGDRNVLIPSLSLQGDKNSDESLQLSEGVFDFKVISNILEIISKLLIENLLLIESDRESGVFSITLICEPKALTERQRNALNQYVAAILEELFVFKKENDIVNDCFKVTVDDEGNVMSLDIMLSPVTLYDAFIERLASKQLLPMQVIQQHDNEVENKDDINVAEYTKGVNHFTNTPFETRPMTKRDGQSEDGKNQTDELETTFKSPFDIPSPRDGCTPDG